MNEYIVSPQRSYIMSRVRGADTRIETTVRSLLHHEGLRFRKNVKRLPGCPDIVLRKHEAVVFIHGCFWHSHPYCSKSRLPATRTEYWMNKMQDNSERDQKNILALRALGWRVAVIWGCALARSESLSETISELVRWIRDEDEYLEIPKPDLTQ